MQRTFIRSLVHPFVRTLCNRAGCDGSPPGVEGGTPCVKGSLGGASAPSAPLTLRVQTLRCGGPSTKCAPLWARGGRASSEMCGTGGRRVPESRVRHPAGRRGIRTSGWLSGPRCSGCRRAPRGPWWASGVVLVPAVVPAGYVVGQLLDRDQRQVEGVAEGVGLRRAPVLQGKAPCLLVRGSGGGCLAFRLQSRRAGQAPPGRVPGGRLGGANSPSAGRAAAPASRRTRTATACLFTRTGSARSGRRRASV
jgi:hypothetical protein